MARDSYRVRLANAKDRYEAAHKHWFEASQEFRSGEGTGGALKSLGCLRAAGGYRCRRQLGQGLAKVASIERPLSLKERIGETNGFLSELEERLSRVKVRERPARCQWPLAFGLRAGAKEHDEVARTFRGDEAVRRLAIRAGPGRDRRGSRPIGGSSAVVSRRPSLARRSYASGRGTVSESEYGPRRAQDGLSRVSAR